MLDAQVHTIYTLSYSIQQRHDSSTVETVISTFLAVHNIFGSLLRTLRKGGRLEVSLTRLLY